MGWKLHPHIDKSEGRSCITLLHFIQNTTGTRCNRGLRADRGEIACSMSESRHSQRRQRNKLPDSTGRIPRRKFIERGLLKEESAIFADCPRQTGQTLSERPPEETISRLRFPFITKATTSERRGHDPRVRASVRLITYREYHDSGGLRIGVNPSRKKPTRELVSREWVSRKTKPTHWSQPEAEPVKGKPMGFPSKR